MEYDAEKREIILKRELSNLDKFVLDFIGVLKKHADYVIISGYVAILLGRSRATEDVDLIIPRLSKDKLRAIWEEILNSGFICVNSLKFEDASELLQEHAIRFSREKRFVPNIEFKMVKNDLDAYSLENKLTVRIKENIFYISPLELQIAYKLFLGTEKDFEDAKHIYELFKEKLNKEELLKLVKLLKVEKEFEVIK